MATVVKAMIASLVFIIPIGSALAGAMDKPCEQPNSDPAQNATRILERTERGGQRPSSLLAAPAALAQWINAHGRRQLAISVTVAR